MENEKDSKSPLRRGVMPVLPDDFKCSWIEDGKIDCAFRDKKCHICTKAVEPVIKNYYAPYKVIKV